MREVYAAAASSTPSNPFPYTPHLPPPPSFTLAKSEINSADLVDGEIQNLQMFLANPMYPRLIIIHQLCEGIKQIDKHEEVLIEIIKLCCTQIETSAYMSPEEKYTLHRALPYLIFLIDGADKKTGFNAFKAKKIYPATIQRVQKIVKSLPIVPEVGDIVINLSEVLTMCPNFDTDKMASAWGIGFTPTVRSRRESDSDSNGNELSESPLHVVFPI